MKHLLKWLQTQDLVHYQHAPGLLLRKYVDEFRITTDHQKLLGAITLEIKYQLHTKHEYKLLLKVLKLTVPEFAKLFGRNKLHKEIIVGAVEVLKRYEKRENRF